ncbi:MAG: hypothetical protein CME62_14005 [Halobacteriovoraceae bacterium]|nr:hypothetical protein [Halobacteriovoraceae bacterium]|tara:strand:+ start:8077 stop:9951 length:1875 start_codon:yes stop_codon:yes gene_type:complete
MKKLSEGNSFIEIFDQHSSIMLLIEPGSGKILGSNKAASDFYGYTKEEFLQLKVFDLNTLSEEGVKNLMVEVSTSQESYFVFQHKLKNGEKRDVEVNTSEINLSSGKAFFSIIKDITKIKKLRDQIKHEKELYQNIMESASDGIHILDRAGNVIHCSYSFANLLGYTREEALKLNVKDWDETIPVEQMVPVIASVIENPKTFETIHKKKDGSVFHAQINAKGIQLAGENFLYASTRDITEQKKLEKDLKNALKAKSVFLANMSHEIRTPMNAIIGLTNMVLETELSDSQFEHLKNIQISTESLLGVINDILDYSKVEAGKLTIENKAFRLKDLIDNLTHIFKFGIEKSGLTFNIYIDPTIPEYILGDSLRIMQVLTNLLSNASKFTPRGSIDLDVAVLEKLGPQTKISFSVKDTGIGIDKEIQKQLFKPFEQGDSSTTRKYGGTGLGLMLSKQLIEAMGGEIKLKSDVDKGSTFEFICTFTTASAEQLSHNDHIQKQKTYQEEFTRRYKALLVEDNQLNIIVTKNLLDKFNFDTDVVMNGEKALNAFHQKDYDIIFLDLHMPKMDGFQCCQEIRKINQEIPIIALSAAVMPDDIKKAKESGMNDHIGKPIRKSNFLKTVKKYLS